MLLSVGLENYRSFREPAVLDLQRRSFKTNRPTDGNWGRATERVAAILGPNASGKSNLLRAIDHLQIAVANSLRDPSSTRRLRNPHALGQESATSFSTDYVAEDIRFRWTVILDDRGVVAEYLDANEHRHWRKVFQRDRNELSFGPKSHVPRAAQENIREFLNEWVLTISAWGGVRTRGDYYPAAEWWLRRVRVNLPLEASHRVQHDALRKLAKHPQWVKVIPEVLRIADVGISAVHFDEREAEVPDELKSLFRRLKGVLESPSDDDNVDPIEEASEEEMEFLEAQLRFTHSGEGSEQFVLDEKDESFGTKAWYDLSVSAVIALSTGQVMIVDELDSSLHPTLVSHLVSLFLSEVTNPTGAQLVFTTHDVTILGKRGPAGLDPSSIWLVEKIESASELFSLDEFSPREAHNLEKRYLLGVFGAIPIVGADLDKHIRSLHLDFLRRDESSK